MDCSPCPIHPIGVLLIIIGCAAAVISHTAVFKDKGQEEGEQKAEQGEPGQGGAEAEAAPAAEEPAAEGGEPAAEEEESPA